MPWSVVTQKKLFQQEKPMRAKQQLIWPLTSTDFKSVDSVVQKNQGGCCTSIWRGTRLLIGSQAQAQLLTGQQLLSRTPAITVEGFCWAALTLPGAPLLIPSSSPSRRISRVLGKVSVVQGNHTCPLAPYGGLGCWSTFLLRLPSSFFAKGRNHKCFSSGFFVSSSLLGKSCF